MLIPAERRRIAAVMASGPQRLLTQAISSLLAFGFKDERRDTGSTVPMAHRTVTKRREDADGGDVFIKALEPLMFVLSVGNL